MAESGVTATSANVYSNRGEAAKLYNNSDTTGGDKTLRESRFWHHAEMIGSERLRTLLRTVRAPGLLKELDAISNPALLNYYFFFPAHEEALGQGCGNIELRKYMDTEGRPGGDHLFLTDGKGTRYVDCAGTELDYGQRLRDDVLNRTATAMDQAHCFLAMQLALEAHRLATPLGGSRPGGGV